MTRVTPQRGSSLVEVVVGFLVLLLMLIGLLPIFTRAVAQNLAGRESTVITAHASTHLETMYPMDFNDPRLRIEADGLRRTVSYRTKGSPDVLGDEGWQSVRTVPLSPWTRTAEVRQFAVSGVRDSDGDGVIDQIVGLEDLDQDGYFDRPLPSTTSRSAVHLKEIRVVIESPRGLLGAGKPRRLTLRSLKAF